MFARPAILSGLMALAAGCATAPDPPRAGVSRPVPQVVGGQRLTGEEFRREVFGNTLDRRMPNGSRMLMHIGADGEQRLRLVAGNGRSVGDRGRVTIRGDEVCSNWERIDAGRETCFAYFRLGTSLVAIDLSGATTPTRFEVLRGNPEGV